MIVFNRVLLGLILCFFMSCEHPEKKSRQLKSQPKHKITTPQKLDKKRQRIIPQEIPVMHIEPNPPGPRLIPYYSGEPPVVHPIMDAMLTQADTIYDVAAFMPEFPGGQEALRNYLQSNLVYPEDAKELGVEGKVILSFVIFEDGSIQQGTILRGINGNKTCEKEALRLIKRMPKWTPGKNELGCTLKVRVRMPVVFSLD